MVQECTTILASFYSESTASRFTPGDVRLYIFSLDCSHLLVVVPIRWNSITIGQYCFEQGFGILGSCPWWRGGQCSVVKTLVSLHFYFSALRWTSVKVKVIYLTTQWGHREGSSKPRPPISSQTPSIHLLLCRPRPRFPRGWQSLILCGHRRASFAVLLLSETALIFDSTTQVLLLYAHSAPCSFSLPANTPPTVHDM